MNPQFPHQWQMKLSLVSYGVHIGIRANNLAAFECLREYLPPGWELSASTVVDTLYSLIINQSPDPHRLYCQQQKLIQTRELEEIFATLDTDLRLRIALASRHKLFVHAGVVGWQGKAIVLPGRSFSGKTTLVAASIEAGAIYYSDEYAVLDTDGWVHPYPRPLSVRQAGGQSVKRLSVEELGGQSGTMPLPVGLVGRLQYQPGGQWSVKAISRGQAVLALLDNTVVARLRPDFALPILARAASGAIALEGWRGEAAEAVGKLFEAIQA